MNDSRPANIPKNGQTAASDGVDSHPSAEVAAWEDAVGKVGVRLRPIASPTALGFFGLAAATLVLSGIQLGWIPSSQGHDVALALMGFAFGAQLIASLFAFMARDVVVATAMAVLAMTWFVSGLVFNAAPPGSRSDALGLFLLFSASAVALCGLTACLGKAVPGAVLLVASIRIGLAGLYELAGGNGWKEAAGTVGLLLFLLAMYTAWAGMLEGALGRPVLPLGRRNRGRIAVDGSLLEQVRGVANEPGVRVQL